MWYGPVLAAIQFVQGTVDFAEARNGGVGWMTTWEERGGGGLCQVVSKTKSTEALVKPDKTTHSSGVEIHAAWCLEAACANQQPHKPQ